jgi:hypothetical protein
LIIFGLGQLSCIVVLGCGLKTTPLGCISMNKNKFKEGLQASGKLRKSFYQFLFGKHIDWAILLSCFFLMLPYLGSKNLYFLLIKILLFVLSTYFIVNYILAWKELDSFRKIWKVTIEKITNVINKNKINDINTPSTHAKIEEFIKTTKEIWPELKLIAEKKITPEEIQNKYPEQVSKLENILNEDLDLTLTVLGSASLGLSLIQMIRNIPIVELKNYRRILFIIFITFLYFLIYALESSLK